MFYYFETIGKQHFNTIWVEKCAKMVENKHTQDFRFLKPFRKVLFYFDNVVGKMRLLHPFLLARQMHFFSLSYQ